MKTIDSNEYLIYSSIWPEPNIFSGNSFEIRRITLTCSHGWILQDDTIVNESDVFEWLRSSRPFASKQMEDSSREDGVFAVLDELAQVRQTGLLRLGILFYDRYDGINDGPLVIETTLENKRDSVKKMNLIQRNLPTK